MAELLFRATLRDSDRVRVSSAGVLALVDEPMDYSSASALEQRGIDPSRHRARQYEPWMAVESDLVLTAERAHRELILAELPRVIHRIFTMKEFARLADRLTSGAPTDVIAQAARIRGVDGAVAIAEDDMPDPYRAPISRARTISDDIEACVRSAISALGADTLPSDRRPSPSRRPRPAPRLT